MNVQRGFGSKLPIARSLLGRGVLMTVTLLAAAAGLTACSGGGNVNIGNSQTADPATVDYPIFYVKRTIPKQSDDLRLLRFAVPSADLYMRASASPSALETNITTRITAGASYDVKDVDSSVDGKKVVFAMRGPLTANMQQKDAPSWRIYEYVIATDTLHPVINPKDDTGAPTVNDVSPHYLPDGRIIFSSSRQKQSQALLLDENKPQFVAEDEDRDEPAFDLHVMNADGTGIQQISYNQSHDRDATVLANGRILWTRWDHAAGTGKDGMHLYTSNPDGTDVQLYYGANSHMTGTNDTVVEFVRPREMQDGRILSLTRQYSGVDFGGSLTIIDGTHYVEMGQALMAFPGLTGPAQTAATTNDVRTIPGPSPGGRFGSAVPVWDGTGRILVTWSQCRLQDTTGAIIPCSSTNIANTTNTLAPPLYSVWMFNPAANTVQPIMQPVEGVMITDVASTQPRTIQNIILDQVKAGDPNPGILDIKSVYDFDGVDTATPNIPTLSDGKTPASTRPARFLRIDKAVSIPSTDVVKLADAAFGASNYMREIVGYVPVEPDGSVRVHVPADVAFQISIVDANARRNFPVHSMWLQVRPSEVVTCNGCHHPATTAAPVSHGRAGLFPAAYAGATTTGTPFPDSVATFTPNAGETMAEARARVSCVAGSVCSMDPTIDVIYNDVWSGSTTLNAPINYLYTGLTGTEAIPTTAQCETTWATNCRIIINYPKHIQPIWDNPRTIPDPTTGLPVMGACTSAGCHSPKNAAGATAQPAGNLDLTNTASNAEPLQFISYRELLFAHNIPGPLDANGNPTTVSVGPYMDAGSANGTLSRTSLALFAPGSGDKIHAGVLSGSELRLISEWLDIGAQYFNNPFDPAVPVN